MDEWQDQDMIDRTRQILGILKVPCGYSADGISGPFTQFKDDLQFAMLPILECTACDAVCIGRSSARCVYEH